MILRLPTEHKMQSRHAGMDGAGTQVRKDAFGDIHVTWIPALHAGMTQLRFRLNLRHPSYGSMPNFSPARLAILDPLSSILSIYLGASLPR
jgi:hypothetical protein